MMHACWGWLTNLVALMDLVPFLLIGPVLVLVIAIVFWHCNRSAAILQKWADDNGYQILEKEFRHFFKGPFFLTASKNQSVYRVTVLDKGGQERSGWVVCGGWWLGMLSDHVKVRWDEVTQPAQSPMRDRWLDG
jgi:hypothetical protein